MTLLSNEPSLSTTSSGSPKISISYNLDLIAPILASAAFVLEITLTPATLPAIRDTLDLELTELSLYLNFYSFMVAFGVLIGGILGDRYDETSTFALGTLLFSAGCFLVLLSGHINLLLLARSVQGLGAGLFIPIVPILLTRATSEKPGRVLIICGAISGYLAAFAPLAYGYFFEAGNWLTPYASLGFFASLAFMLSMASSKKYRKASIDRLYSSGLSLLMNKGLMSIYVYIFCTYGAVTYYLFKSPIVISDNGFNAITLGGTLTVLWITFSTVSLVLRNLVDSACISIVLAAAPVSLILGLVLLGLPPSPAVLMISAFLVGVGLACSNSPSTQVVLKFAPKEHHSLSSSLDFTFARLGGMVCCTLSALLAPYAQTIILSCLLAAAMVAVGIVRSVLHQRSVL